MRQNYGLLGEYFVLGKGGERGKLLEGDLAIA